MVREIKEKGKKGKGLMEDKNYIAEAWLQGGKAVGEMIKPKRKKK
jgi:hypothetical protein